MKKARDTNEENENQQENFWENVEYVLNIKIYFKETGRQIHFFGTE